MARCEVFRFALLRSAAHSGPISWALGRCGQKCKMMFNLMPTPPPCSFLDTNQYMQLIVPINHTTASRERPLTLFAVWGQKRWTVLRSSCAFIPCPCWVQWAVHLYSLGATVSKHNSEKRFLTGSLQEGTQYMKFTFGEWCIRIKV